MAALAVVVALAAVTVALAAVAAEAVDVADKKDNGYIKGDTKNTDF